MWHRRFGRGQKVGAKPLIPRCAPPASQSWTLRLWTGWKTKRKRNVKINCPLFFSLFKEYFLVLGIISSHTGDNSECKLCYQKDHVPVHLGNSLEWILDRNYQQILQQCDEWDSCISTLIWSKLTDAATVTIQIWIFRCDIICKFINWALVAKSKYYKCNLNSSLNYILSKNV